MSSTSTTTTKLFKPRLSSQDLQSLLESATRTHETLRRGSLSADRSTTSKDSQSEHSTTSPNTKTNKILETPGTEAKTTAGSGSTTPLGKLVGRISRKAESPLPISPLSTASQTKLPPSGPRGASPSPRRLLLPPITPPPITPTSASSTFSSSPSRLPSRLRNKIIESVSLNRLTIIVGPTGCGKSTLVPPILRQVGGAVLCTQPRRLAVVAIAQRVASEQGIELGGDKVGFHVGNHNLSTHQTQLLFTTAGILLEELRANGSEALKRFRVLIIDECHERSPESDLILSLVKKYLQRHPKSSLRLVLMSATFPHSRYRDYFRDVPGCNVVDTITLESAQAFVNSTNVETFYLEDILPFLPDKHRLFGRQMRLNPDADLDQDEKNVSDNMLLLIKDLVKWLDTEESPRSPFLIFAPTYRHLEQLHAVLTSEQNQQFSISVLHSSVDMDDCLRSIQHATKTDQDQNRHLLLASAIADSSVTVPGVSVVIDMCRALEVQWNGERHVARTVWASKSICDQRKGRTGRTCPGRVFRLLHRGFYLSRLPEWEIPQLTLSSCLNEILGLVCSKPDLVEANPRSVLQNCLDPPSTKIVEDAIQFLQEMGAIQPPKTMSSRKDDSRKVYPTQYGEILAALPLTASDAKVVLAGGQLGLLHETLALRAIYNHKPSPIVHTFGDAEKNIGNLESYFRKAKSSANSTYLAHLSAYMFWDFEWNQKRRREANKLFWDRSRDSTSTACYSALAWQSVNVWKWTPELEDDHVQWCKAHDINPTAVRSIQDIVENTMNALFLSKFEPEWLRCADPTPAWKRSRDWKGNVQAGRDMLYRVYGPETNIMCNTLLALLENRIQAAATLVGQMADAESSLACIHFIQGTCKYGPWCRNSHDSRAKRPPCRFFLAGNCSKGKDCLYCHNEEDEASTSSFPVSEGGELLLARLPLLPHLSIAGGPRGWFEQNYQRLLLLGEGNFKFSDALLSLGIPPFLASTNVCDAATPTVDGRFLLGVDATRLHINPTIVSYVQAGLLDTFAWNFPYTGHDEDQLIHEALMLETFHSLSLLLTTAQGVWGFQFAVALQADQFSRWNLMHRAWKTGWRLTGWSEFDHTVFPGYFPSRHVGEAFPVEEARFYIFTLHKGDGTDMECQEFGVMGRSSEQEM